MKIFKIIAKNSLNKYSKIILDFYQPYYPGENYKKALENSSFIAICIEGGRVIGAGRVATDCVRHAMIYDLIVKKEFRKQGIGLKLTKIMIRELKKMKVKYIALTYEKKSPWLKKFYQKTGFAEDKYCNYLIIRS